MIGREPPFDPWPGGGPGCWRSSLAVLLLLATLIATLAGTA